MAAQFVGNGPLSGHDEEIVEGVHEFERTLGANLFGVPLRRGVVVADQHDLGPQPANGANLDLRCRPRHDDKGRDVQRAGGVGDSLGVVSGAGAHHASRPAVRLQLRDLVVGAAQLEAEHGLEVLTLEQHRDANAGRKTGGGLERGLTGDVVDATGQNLPQEPLDQLARGPGGHQRMLSFDLGGI